MRFYESPLSLAISGLSADLLGNGFESIFVGSGYELTPASVCSTPGA